MSKSGINNYKGIITQSLAALSIFLQYLVRKDFQYVIFEAEKLNDFVLVFSDGHKIICEVKSFQVSYPQVREILDSLVKGKKVGNSDEILIICRSAHANLKSDLKNYKYFEDILKEKLLKKKRFTEEHLKLIPRVKFWEVDKRNITKTIDALFANALDMWVPASNFQEMISDILLKKVYYGSGKGSSMSREEFLDLLQKRKNEIKNDSRYYTKKEAKLKQVEGLIQALQNPNDKSWSNNAISSLTGSPELYYLAIKKLEEKEKLQLKDWDSLWQAASRGIFSLRVFKIFTQNIEDANNQKYLMNFLPNLASNLVSFYRDEFITVDIVEICDKILDRSNDYDKIIFEILKSLLEENSKEYFYIKRNRDNSWEEGKICEVLKKLYEKTTKEDLKNEIINYILDFFNLIEDDGQFWHYTPPSIFSIVKQYAEDEIESKLLSLSEKFISQYQKFYEKFGAKFKFNGWEHIGFTDTDRHFLTQILEPLLRDYFSKDPERAWKFITEKLVTRKESQVSAQRPDYLNRASIDTILMAYKMEGKKADALGILKDFIEMKKGIPHKTDVIFRKVISFNLNDDQKWELVKIQLDCPQYKGLPANKHVENIISQLAKNGHQEALKVLEAWTMNPDYNKYHGGPIEGNIITSVSGLLSNPSTKQDGINMFGKFLSSDTFKQKTGLWHVWEIAKVLTQLLSIDFEQGKLIIEQIWNNNSLTKNQQIILTSSIQDIEKDDVLLKKVFDEIVSVWFSSLDDDNSKIVEKISDIQSRISIVRFGEKLAKADCYIEAFRIAKAFLNDPDPTLENDADDPEGKQNFHKLIEKGEDVSQITTVRASVAMLLQSMAVLNGRELIPGIIPLIEALTKDPNYYVRAYACIPLEQLARIRNTVLPTNRTERFLDFETSTKIEAMAWSMLRERENWKLQQIMVSLVRIFSYFRSVTKEEAKEIVDTFIGTKNDVVIEEARNLIIFFAEFRSKLFNEDSLKYVFSKEKIISLRNFDESYFKELLKDILINYSEVVRAGFAWSFWHLPKEPGINFEDTFKISYEYFKILTQKYDHDVMVNIYYFIEDFIDLKFEECIDLWIKCLEVERPYLQQKASKDNLYQLNWWPYHYNGKILDKLFERKGQDEFIKWLDYLLMYPDGVIIIGDIAIVVDYLVTIPISAKSKKLFIKFASRYPEYFETMKKWLALDIN